MRTAKILSGRDQLANEFQRCCHDYDSLRVAVAWCGDPKQTLPFKHLNDFNGKITATVGYSFNQTHPNSIDWLLGKASVLRVFRREKGLFHPKLYLFTNDDRYALFAGSSNLTYGGFYENVEANVLIEGAFSSDAADVSELQMLLEKWNSNEFSFKPSKIWLDRYRKEHKRDRDAQRKAGLKTEAFEEENFGPNWLEKADWDTYHQQVVTGIKKHGRDINHFHQVLNAAATNLQIPWTPAYFKDKERRRIIGGVEPYGTLGHVFSSGAFGKLIKRRTRSWPTLVSAVNEIATLTPPIDWRELEASLRRLSNLGNTMKVWGRILALIRPAFYCSVSSIAVRRELGKTLKVPMESFERVEGYIKLLKLLHSSPWFNSQKPKTPNEVAIWDRRVAFMDGIFWAPKTK